MNDKPNGIIKTYKNNNLLHEIEYFDGKKLGKAKEYYDNGKMRFKGEYLDDITKKGIVYDKKGNVIFEGDLKNYIFENNHSY